MIVGIMQPYFLPYIGYFQLIKAVDKFVVYDNIQFTKKGWIHRNRMLGQNGDEMFTLPIKKDSDFLNISGRVLSDESIDYRKKILRKISNNYRKSPNFDKVYPLIESIFLTDKSNLFDFLINSLMRIVAYLEIDTEIIISSSINHDHTLKSQDRVIALCKKLNATLYFNLSGGRHLYDYKMFETNGIELKYFESNAPSYGQFGNAFIDKLSILDVLMFNSKDKIFKMLEQYELD